MGIFINQGKQDTSQDRSFEPFESELEVAVIDKIELDTKWENTLVVTFRIMDGDYKGRLIWDRVSFAPSSNGTDHTWKYRSLRKAACVPYDENEPGQVDIEGLLLGRAIDLKLWRKDGKEGAVYQGVKFLVNKERCEMLTPTEVNDTGSAEVIINDEDLPFDNSPATDEDSPW